MEPQKQKGIRTMQNTRITVEQRCYAAQALWYAANKMLESGDPRACEWEQCIGYSQMRYKCRCRAVVETFFEAYKTTEAQNLWPVPEDFSGVFLRVCMTRKSMNCNRDWQTYLQKEIAHKGNTP